MVLINKRIIIDVYIDLDFKLNIEFLNAVVEQWNTMMNVLLSHVDGSQSNLYLLTDFSLVIQLHPKIVLQ